MRIKILLVVFPLLLIPALSMSQQNPDSKPNELRTGRTDENGNLMGYLSPERINQLRALKKRIAKEAVVGTTLDFGAY